MATDVLSLLTDLEQRPGAKKYAHGEYNLDGYRTWLASTGVPKDGTPWIHVAGTKGKGSTCAMLEALLRAAGLRTGLYTSPHLDHYGQRFRIAGAAWTPEEFQAALARIAPQVTEDRTVFEVLTAIAFREFAAAGVQAGILETGLGGRLDCTNVVDSPRVCAITSIGIDHADLLGDTVEKIAREKAGILKPGCPAVVFDATDESSERARRVIEAAAREVGALLFPAAQVRMEAEERDGLLLEAAWRGARETFRLPLRGRFQASNFAVALRAAEIFLESLDVRCEGAWLGRAASLVDWPGRLEFLPGDPPLLLDAAHCPMSARALGRALHAEPFASSAPFAVLWGMQADKDARGFAEGLLATAPRGALGPVVCYRVPGSRGAEAGALAATARSVGLDAHAAPGVEDAWNLASSHGHPVLACGTLYTIGMFRKLHARGQ